MIVFDPKCHQTVTLEISGAKATIRPKTVREVAADRAAQLTPDNLTMAMCDSVAAAIVELKPSPQLEAAWSEIPRIDERLLDLPYPDLMQLVDTIGGLTHRERKNSDTSSPS